MRKLCMAATGKATIAHEAITTLYWPAMTMSFTVKDKALLDQLTIGKKVNFQLMKEGTEYVITGVK